MSAVKPTREGPAFPIPTQAEAPGDVDGDNVDWPTGGTSGDGIFELRNEGGQSFYHDLGNMGSATDVDPTNGNVQYGTLDDDCLVTLLAPGGDDASTVELWVTQDGTGAWVLTVDADGGSFAWDGATPAPDTTAGVTVRYVFERVPGSTNDWVGNLVGGTGGTGSAIEILDDGVSLTAGVTSIDFTGAGVAATAVGDAVTVAVGIWVPVMVEDVGTGLWYVTVTGDGDAVMTEVP